jgi:hypothetical protein
VRIAAIGWGSVLWRPGELTLLTGRWHKDGPTLPIEFARRSQGEKRLTLAIAPVHGVPVPTYWALSAARALPDARENLRVRESTPYLKNIFAVENGGVYWGRDRDPEVRVAILGWLDQQADLDAAIWTGLKANWPEGEDLNFGTVDRYIRAQSTLNRAGIKNYVRRAPAQVNTPIRRKLEERLGWTRIPLPAGCFEDGVGEA